MGYKCFTVLIVTLPNTNFNTSVVACSVDGTESLNFEQLASTINLGKPDSGLLQ